MNIDIGTILEHSALAGVLLAIIQFMLVPMINRLMDRIDALTDRIMQMVENQDKIISQQAEIQKHITDK